MKRGSVRFFLFYVSLSSAVFAAGQRGQIEKLSFLPDLKSEVIEKMKEKNNYEECQFRWADANNVIQKPLAIKHYPEDFNVYFTISHLVTPNIKTSMEVSLNNMGIVNLRHMIALRKKDRE